jgi:hypothetical protein
MGTLLPLTLRPPTAGTGRDYPFATLVDSYR